MKRKLFVLIALVLLISVLGTVLVGCNFGNVQPDGGNETDNGNDSTNNGNGNQNDDNNQDNGNTTPTEPTFLDEVNEFGEGLLETSKLEKVVGVYVEDGTLIFQGVFHDGLWHLKVYFGEGINIESISDAIDNKENIRRIRTISSYETVPYNSAQALIESGDFGQYSQMQNYLDEGWTFEVVSAQTVKGSNDGHFYIYATYKLTKEQETKFIQQVMSVALTEEASNSQEKNYIESVRDPDARIVRDMSFVELTGDAEEYAKQLYELNKANSESK